MFNDIDMPQGGRSDQAPRRTLEKPRVLGMLYPGYAPITTLDCRTIAHNDHTTFTAIQSTS